MPGDFRCVWAARDLDASIAFYRDGLGLPVVESWDDPDGKGAVIEVESGQIEVLEVTGERPYVRPAGVRLAYEVRDVDDLHRALVARGVEVAQPPTDWPWNHRNIEVVDPDGITIAPYQVIG